MTTQHQLGTVPRIERYHRMKIALEHAGVGVQEMADYLGVTKDRLFCVSCRDALVARGQGFW